MLHRYDVGTVLLLCAVVGACGSNDDSGGSGGTSATSAGTGGTGGSLSSSLPGAGAQGGGAGSASTGAGGQSGGTGAASTGAGGQGGGAGSAMMGGAGSSAMPAGSGTSLTGTLGALGAVQPTVSSLVISNSGETLIYMSSAPISCELLTMSRWLGSVATGSQVVEIVVPSNRATGTLTVASGAEVNYAPGGMSSAYEKTAASGSVTFTTSTPNGVVEGNVTASYANPTGSLSGTFHAEFCAGGQGY